MFIVHRSSFIVVALLLAHAAVAQTNHRWVERTLRSMALDEKIGQMLLTGSPIGGFRSLDSPEFEQVRRDIVQFHVGGIHLYAGDPAAIALSANEMQRLAKVPLFTTENFEGGAGYVLYGTTRFPLAMAIGATGDVANAYEAAKITAEEGRAAGVNVNFYPVADVQNNPENPIINIRSFGEDPAMVARFVAAYVRGTQENGEMATAKHFPGHGDVASDSHLQMPVLDVNRQRLEATELPPFKAAVAAGVDAVMSAHIWLPQIEPEKNVPATLSKNIITGLLRDELHFEGVVFTDAMTMRGVTSMFGGKEATLRALEAGADIILGPPSIEESFNAIKAAVESGQIPQSRIDASVRRILEAKAKLNLQDPKNRFVDVNMLMTVLGTKAHRDFAQQIEDRAITLVRDEHHVLPLRPSPDLRVVQINVIDSRSGWREGAAGRVVGAELLKRFPRAVTVQVDDQSTPNEFDIVHKLAQTGDAIVVNGFIRVAAYKGSIDLTSAETSLLRDLAKMDKPFVFTVFGSPYVLTHIPEMPSYIVTYDTSPLAEYAMVKAITGEIPFQGKLPISLPGLYPVGHALAVAGSQLPATGNR